MAIKKQIRGKIIGSMANYDIRRIPKFEGRGKDRKEITSTIGIFRAKKLIQDGFKNTQEALEYIMNLIK